MFIDKLSAAVGTVVLAAAVCFGSGIAAEKVDRYGDPLPVGALRRLGTVSLRHGHKIDSVAFLPDGKTIVSGSGDGTVRSWDVATGKQTSAVPTNRNQGGTRFAVSPDGKTIAVISTRLTVIELYDVATAKRIAVMDHAHNSNIKALAFFLDGRRLASASSDRTVKIWRLPGAQPLRTFAEHGKQVSCVAVSPDGKTIASGIEFGNGSVLLWEADTGKVLHKIEAGHGRRVFSAAFSPDGKRLATSGCDERVSLWDVATGNLLRKFDIVNVKEFGGYRDVAVTFSRDGSGLLISAYGKQIDADGPGQIGLWDIQTGRQIRKFAGLPSGAACVAQSPDGRLVAAAGSDAVVGVWDFSTGKRLLEKPEPSSGIRCLALSPQGNRLACGMYDGSGCLRDIAGGPVTARLPVCRSLVYDVCFSRDGRLVAAVGADHKSADCMARIWTVDKAALLHQFACGKGMGTAVAVSPDGRWFAAANAHDKQVRLWDLEAGALMHAFSPTYRNSDWPVNVFFTPDGKRIIASSKRNLAHTWDVASGKQLTEGRGSSGTYVTANSPDARWIVSGGNTGNVQIWDPAGKGGVLDLSPEEGADSEFCFGAAFSHDGRYVATSHHPERYRMTSDLPQPPLIRIWELASGSEVMRWKGHRGRVWGLAFSADFRVLVSGSRDTTVLVWPLDPYAAGVLLTVPPKKEPSLSLPVGDPFAQRSLPMETDDTRNDAVVPAVDPPGELDEDSLTALWQQLADEAPRAYQAKWRLIRHSRQAIRLFAEHLKPVTFDPTKARRWAAQLDDHSFATREHAFQQLARLGELAHGVLRETLEQGASVEVKARIRRLLAAHHPLLVEDKETLRACRAIEVLERIGSPEARELIDQLASGAADATVTQHARAAKARHSRTAVRPPRE